MIGPEHIIYPIGNLGSGRTEFSRYLSDFYGFHSIDSMEMVRSIYENRNEEHRDLSLGQYMLLRETANPMFFNDHLVTKIQDLTSENDVIIEGIRTDTDVERLSQTYPNTEHSIVLINAGFQLIKARYNQKEEKDLSDYDFSKLTALDLAKGIASLREKARFKIENNGSIDALRINADSVMLRLGILALR